MGTDEFSSRTLAPWQAWERKQYEHSAPRPSSAEDPQCYRGMKPGHHGKGKLPTPLSPVFRAHMFPKTGGAQ